MLMTSGGSFKSGTFAKVGLVVWGILISLILLEVLLRIFDPLGINYYFEVARYFRNMVPDPSFAYIHRPGYTDTLQGVEVTINKEGFRGPEFQAHKPEGTTRVLILGDSVVFGWGVPQESIFPAYLQNMFDANHFESEVMAAGVGSWNTRKEFEFMKERGVDYESDILILVVVPNDIEPDLRGNTEVSKEKLSFVSPQPPGYLCEKIYERLVRRSYLLQTLEHFRKRMMARDELLEMYTNTNSPAWEDAKAALSGLISLCRDRGINLVVFLYGDGSVAFSETGIRAYSSFLQEQDAVYHVFYDEIFEPKYRNSFVDAHPNAAGHQLMAQNIFEAVQPLLSEKTLEEKLRKTSENHGEVLYGGRSWWIAFGPCAIGSPICE